MFTEKQVFHKYFNEQELLSFIETHGGKTFLQCNYKTETEEIIILGNKKGHVSKITKKLSITPTASKNSIIKNFSSAEQNFSSAEYNSSSSELSSAEHNSALSGQNNFPLQNFGKVNKQILAQTNLNNRKKNYLLPEGNPIPFLILLGIMTGEGKIIASKYDKFKQINRFLEFIDDIIDNVINDISVETFNESHNKAEKPDSPISKPVKTSSDVNAKSQSSNLIRPIQITDFGCGKSYLTFAVYYYLTEIKKIPVNIIGLDLKEDVIAYCNTLAEKMGFSNLHFAIGNIADYKYTQDPDIIITLHACDTATDYALQYAVEHNAKAILSVPCCQHEVNIQLDKQKSTLAENSVFSSLLKYGLIKERFSSLVTDAIRADFLESQNYKVQILEFIDMEHTPKNLLIRAVKKDRQDNESVKKAKKRIETLCGQLNIRPTIL